MNCAEIAEIFIKNDVPRWFYSFKGAGRGDCYALEAVDGSWRLSYYTERGGREEEGVFTTEDEGCQALFKAVQKMVYDDQHRTITLESAR